VRAAGAGDVQFTADGKRGSTAAAYLDAARLRPNLHVITDAHVTRVIINGNEATGVQFVRANKVYSVLANKEVVLSAGAIGSAHILLLSGIGPAEQLNKFGVSSRRPALKYDVNTGLELRRHGGNICE